MQLLLHADCLFLHSYPLLMLFVCRFQLIIQAREWQAFPFSIPLNTFMIRLCPRLKVLLYRRFHAAVYEAAANPSPVFFSLLSVPENVLGFHLQNFTIIILR